MNEKLVGELKHSFKHSPVVIISLLMETTAIHLCSGTRPAKVQAEAPSVSSSVEDVWPPTTRYTWEQKSLKKLHIWGKVPNLWSSGFLSENFPHHFLHSSLSEVFFIMMNDEGFLLEENVLFLGNTHNITLLTKEFFPLKLKVQTLTTLLSVLT